MLIVITGGTGEVGQCSFTQLAGGHSAPARRGLDSIEIPHQFHSNWIGDSKTKFVSGWQPHTVHNKIVDPAFDFERSRNDLHVVWYPG